MTTGLSHTHLEGSTMSNSLNFNASTHASAAKANLIDEILLAGGIISFELETIINEWPESDLTALGELLTQFSQTQSSFFGTARSTAGLDALRAKQPLALSGGAPALGAGPSKYSPAIEALGDAIKAELHERPAELNVLTTRIGEVLHGNDSNEVIKLRKELSDAQKENDRLKTTTTVTPAAGVPQADHDKVKNDLVRANKELADAKQQLQSLKDNPTLLDKVKAALKVSKMTGKVMLDESKLDKADLVALGIDEKKK